MPRTSVDARAPPSAIRHLSQRGACYGKKTGFGAQLYAVLEIGGGTRTYRVPTQAEVDRAFVEAKTRLRACADRCHFGLQRLRQSISFAVRSKTIASAICASRWAGRRSVLRRSWPKFDSQLLVRSIGQRRPSGTSFLAVAVPRGRSRSGARGVSDRTTRSDVLRARGDTSRAAGLGHGKRHHRATGCKEIAVAPS